MNSNTMAPLTCHTIFPLLVGGPADEAARHVAVEEVGRVAAGEAGSVVSQQLAEVAQHQRQLHVEDVHQLVRMTNLPSLPSFTILHW